MSDVSRGQDAEQEGLPDRTRTDWRNKEFIRYFNALANDPNSKIPQKHLVIHKVEGKFKLEQYHENLLELYCQVRQSYSEKAKELSKQSSSKRGSIPFTDKEYLKEIIISWRTI